MNWSEQAKIQSDDLVSGDNFGISADICSNYAIVGARAKNSGAGAAYIFKRYNRTLWSQTYKFSYSDTPASNDYFGNGVAIDNTGTYSVVGAPQRNTKTGNVYIFKKQSNESWSEIQKIVGSNVGTNEYFGWETSFSNNGDYLAISAKEEASATVRGGRIFIFRKQNNETWSEQDHFNNSTASGSDLMGHQVKIDSTGTYVIASAPYDGAVTDDGAAFIFKRTGTSWSEIYASIPPDLSDDKYGFSLGMSYLGNYAFIGNYKDDTVATDSGEVVILKNNNGTWSEQSSFRASGISTSYEFGRGVIMNEEENLIITTDRSGNGHIYFIELQDDNSWSEINKLTMRENLDYNIINAYRSNYLILGDYTNDNIYIYRNERNPASGGDPYLIPIRNGGKIIKLKDIDGGLFQYLRYQDQVTGESLTINVMTWIPQLKINTLEHSYDIEVKKFIEEPHSFIRYVAFIYTSGNQESRMILDMENLEVVKYEIPNFKKYLSQYNLPKGENVPFPFKLSDIYCQEKVRVIQYLGTNVPERKIDIQLKNKTITLVAGLVPDQQLFRNYFHLLDTSQYVNDDNIQGLMIDYQSVQNITSIWQKGSF